MLWNKTAAHPSIKNYIVWNVYLGIINLCCPCCFKRIEMREMAAAVLTKSILSPSFPLSLHFQHLVKRHFLHYATKRFIPSTIYLITDNLADTINTFCISISPVFLSKQMLRTFCYIIFLPAYSSQASHICKPHAAAACVSLCDSVSYVLLPWGRTCNRAFYTPPPSLCQSWLNTYSATR